MFKYIHLTKTNTAEGSQTRSWLKEDPHFACDCSDYGCYLEVSRHAAAVETEGVRCQDGEIVE